MKELSIEEKAKRYDELKVTAQQLEHDGCFDKLTLFDLFPELKESEDEKIRKWIIENIQETLDVDGFFEEQKTMAKKAIAWLEKKSTPQVRTGLEWVDTIDDVCNKRYSEEYAHGEYCHEQSFKWGFQEGVDWLEKQGEQKSVDDLTQQEAMDIAVAKCFEQGEQKSEEVDNLHNYLYGEQNPAWNEEDELHIRELESLVKQAWAIAEHENDKETIHKMSNLSFFLKTLKPQPKQEWKQENTGGLTDFENAMMHIGESFFGDNAGLDPNDTNAIKEQANLLLELVSKQEWSDVDKDILFRITDNLKFLRDTISIDPKYAVNIIDIEREITWLKDLKDRVQSQNMWKPNEEQMNAFDAVLVYNPPCSNECRNHLITLYNELKKLKEE